jgi:hypothetical protein
MYLIFSTLCVLPTIMMPAADENSFQDYFYSDAVEVPGKRQEYCFIAINHVGNTSRKGEVAGRVVTFKYMAGIVGFCASPDPAFATEISATIKHEIARLYNEGWNTSDILNRNWLLTAVQVLQKGVSAIALVERSSVNLYGFDTTRIGDPTIHLTLGADVEILYGQPFIVPATVMPYMRTLMPYHTATTSCATRLQDLKHYLESCCAKAKHTHMAPVMMLNKQAFIALVIATLHNKPIGDPSAYYARLVAWNNETN